MFGKIKEIGTGIKDTVSEKADIVSEAYDSVEVIPTNVKKVVSEKAEAALEAYDSVEVIPTNIKEELFSALLDNKDEIINKVHGTVKDTTGKELDKFIISILYMFLPFPLNILISEEVFEKLILSSPELIEILFENAPELIELLIISN